MNIQTTFRQFIPVKLGEVVARKPLFFVVLSLGYLIIVGFLKWKISPPVVAAFYLAGGIFGIYFLDVAEVFFILNPSPFRSVIFQWLFVATSFFVVTSSGSLLASGLVLSLYLTMILWQLGEWKIAHNLSSWYRLVAGVTSAGLQRGMLVVFIVMFFVETFLFIR